MCVKNLPLSNSLVNVRGNMGEGSYNRALIHSFSTEFYVVNFNKKYQNIVNEGFRGFSMPLTINMGSDETKIITF